MYESFYGFSAKPFQLKPDPNFFFGSKGHKRAMAYLEYGVSQGEGFIVITGEVGAGKTTLVRNLFRKLPAQQIVAAQIVNTHVDGDDILRLVAAGFGLSFFGMNKSTLLVALEQFLKQVDSHGKRALLVVDEAQNLPQRAVEELRMLSNFQSNDKSLLQTFLVGQPEFRKIMLGADMKQLMQRVIATYHLGPLDAEETAAYIQHRLQTVGWKGNPSIDAAAYQNIHAFTNGVPRRINSLCDRLFLMGYLDELHAFGAAEVGRVIDDINQEMAVPSSMIEKMPRIDSQLEAIMQEQATASLENVNERLDKLERSIGSLLGAVKRIASSSSAESQVGHRDQQRVL